MNGRDESIPGLSIQPPACRFAITADGNLPDLDDIDATAVNFGQLAGAGAGGNKLVTPTETKSMLLSIGK